MERCSSLGTDYFLSSLCFTAIVVIFRFVPWKCQRGPSLANVMHKLQLESKLFIYFIPRYQQAKHVSVEADIVRNSSIHLLFCFKNTFIGALRMSHNVFGSCFVLHPSFSRSSLPKLLCVLLSQSIDPTILVLDIAI